MNSRTCPDLTTPIIEKAKAFGASSAGIASIAALKNAPSYQIDYLKIPYYEVYGKAEWPETAKSVLVWTLAHKRSELDLDWWDHKPGHSPGNRQLISITESLKQWVSAEFNINPRPVPYKIEKGGIFLKDAAVLAGLGGVGKNNLLITPECWACVRIRAMFLDVELEPTGPTDFNPCETCDMLCMRACPQRAFRDGSYNVDLCLVQMGKDEANEMTMKKSKYGDAPRSVVKYCRVCELACPAA